MQRVCDSELGWRERCWEPAGLDGQGRHIRLKGMGPSLFLILILTILFFLALGLQPRRRGDFIIQTAGGRALRGMGSMCVCVLEKEVAKGSIFIVRGTILCKIYSSNVSNSDLCLRPVSELPRSPSFTSSACSTSHKFVGVLKQSSALCDVTKNTKYLSQVSENTGSQVLFLWKDQQSISYSRKQCCQLLSQKSSYWLAEIMISQFA